MNGRNGEPHVFRGRVVIEPESGITTPAEMEEFAKAVAKRVIEALRESPHSELLDKEDLARRLGIGTSTIDRQVRKGVIPTVRIGKRVKFDIDAVRTALANQNNKGTSNDGGNNV